ncbi:TATA-binding protein-associated factor 172-like [Acropora muricata]|uniref:TATA-binding protein-associated factor 172-like n=1 Tax=Acropora muricata TaxID=159855 RepID=UPI0034E5538B
MATRLERLLLLLDTGSTAVTRKAAAQQLGEVQKLHPHELPNLLNRVHVFLKSSSWDTRIAAGQAIEAIAQNVPQWDPVFSQKVKEEPQEGDKEEAMVNIAESELLEFSKFDINRVLKHGERLVGSSGAEYDLPDEDLTGLEPKERLSRQQKLLRKRLGLDIAPGIDVGMDKLFDDEDLIVSAQEGKGKSLTKQKSFESAADVVAAEIAAISSSSMSAREKNRAIRKAKMMAKQRSKDASKEGDSQQSNSFDNDVDSEQGPASKKRKTASVIVDQPAESDKMVVDQVTDVSATFEESTEWPFENFCQELCQDLFHQSWEVRHGAATGLREIIKVHGQGAGKTLDASQSLEELQIQNRKWLENMSLHLLCEMALDRFGDFVSDEVVAPVRETCAQTIGVILKHTDAESVKRVMMVLLTLQAQEEWEVRHGGLMGLKYLMAVRQDLTRDLLPLVLDPIVTALKDDDDDVRAVAASALLPVAESLVTFAPSRVQEVLVTLWDTLVELDELTASTNSIMMLLAGILSCPSVTQQGTITGNHASLTALVPRLWPFLRHSIKSVRLAVLETIKTLLGGGQQQKLGSGTSSLCSWLTPILQESLRHIYQRFILETDSDVLELAYKVWHEMLERSPKTHLGSAVIPFLNSWLCMMMMPACAPIDQTVLVHALHRTQGKSNQHLDRAHMIRGRPSSEPQSEVIGGATLALSPAVREQTVLQARLAAARAIGLLACHFADCPAVSEDELHPLTYLMQTLLFPLKSNTGIQRLCASLILSEWATYQMVERCPEENIKQLNSILSEQVVYDEIALLNTRLQTDCQSLLMALRERGIDASAGIQPGCYTVDSAIKLASDIFQEACKKISPHDVKLLEVKRRHLMTTIGQMQSEYHKLHIRVQASVASSLIFLNKLPMKLNPVIRPIMDSIKKEEQVVMQTKSAKALAKLLELCMVRDPCPNPKIIKNLCAFACSDPAVTPNVNLNVAVTTEEPPPSPSPSPCPSPSPSPSPSPGGCQSESNCNSVASNTSTSLERSNTVACDQYNGILLLVQQQKNAGLSTSKKTNSSIRGGQLPAGVDGVVQATAEENGIDDAEANKALSLQRRGSEFALIQLANHMGSSLPSKLPKLWEAIVGPLQQINTGNSFDADKLVGLDTEAQNLVNCLQVLEILIPAFHVELLSKILFLLPNLLLCLQHPYCAVRHLAARCIGVLTVVSTQETMRMVVEDILPLMGTADIIRNRQGAVEAISCVIEKLGMGVVPYVVLLVVPVLGRMSDQCEDVRLMATYCFATLIRFMPLESGIPDPPSMTQAMVQKKQKERKFLEQLLDGKKVENYTIPVPIKAELRKYQQDGVNWLAFLSRYKLHGILCDDMGLGKTLQTICIVAGDHHSKATAYKETGNSDCKPLPSLVICPPTLTGHWVYEVEKFVSKDFLKPLHYSGPPAERQRLRNKVKNHSLVVASYDIVRNDGDFFRSLHWNYCVLDEGHIIKNGKTKLAKVIKQLRASHRLILSGTPIQNNVLELWSLFDFLMPGFLGTEKQFQARFGKPILQSRDAKSSSKEQEAGALAMESLHRQVLPFLLRRLKEDVLQDLPPKIIQDYYCELSPLQVQLYEDFAKSQVKRGLDESVSHFDDDKGGKRHNRETPHIFQALQYLRKVCNHPLLVLTSNHPEYNKVMDQLHQQNLSIRDIQHAAKLVALKQLLVDCGIGVSSSSPGSSDLSSDPVVSQHRVLLFCQLKSMLDIVENDLLKKHMPSVTYLRLDGSTPAGSRHSLVQRFNNDPSIDILLLTTHVGGLGLNLTGADTVIFVEHDWNPMKDLQAMDRAHRIGQKKVVNVYRLITRGTLEEKIMGLQKFKLNIANTVISQDNSSLSTMDTGQLLDLFTVEKEKKKEKSSAKQNNPGQASLKTMMENLGELWDEEQYETEYNLDNFIESLK